MEWSSLDVRALQAAWTVLLLASPALCWRCARVAGARGGQALLVVALPAAVALAAVAWRDDEPLHANGHAWREAREVLMPTRGRDAGVFPFEHGRGAIALQWLIAAVEDGLTGTINPFRISRLAGAAAAAATALLAIVLAGSTWAGLAAGVTLALMPLGQMLALSGSALAIAAWLLPLSLALTLAAAAGGDAILLGGAALAAALGTLSHTAMLAWLPALGAVWLITARGRARWSDAAIAAGVVAGLAWAVELANAYELLRTRNEGTGLLDAAWRGFAARDLFVDPRWVSPLLVPLALVWVASHLRRGRWQKPVAVLLAFAIGALPFFAVTACSSDAVRYQGAWLGVITAAAVAAVWQSPLAARLGRYAFAAVAVLLLLALVALPVPSARPPLDPTTLEHRLVEEAVRHMTPGTVIVLPNGRFADGRVIPEFPAFLLPARSRVVRDGEPGSRDAAAPRLIYLGLACISWGSEPAGEGGGGDAGDGMRPECRGLRAGTRPWLVRSIAAGDLPRDHSGDIWTFHRLALAEPFGFFVPVDEPARGGG